MFSGKCIFNIFSLTVFAVIILANSCDKSELVFDLSKSPGPGYTLMFNGKDFTGWKDIQEDGAWLVENGLIHCKGKPGEPYLILTENDYENFDFYKT